MASAVADAGVLVLWDLGCGVDDGGHGRGQTAPRPILKIPWNGSLLLLQLGLLLGRELLYFERFTLLQHSKVGDDCPAILDRDV